MLTRIDCFTIADEKLGTALLESSLVDYDENHCPDTHLVGFRAQRSSTISRQNPRHWQI